MLKVFLYFFTIGSFLIGKYKNYTCFKLYQINVLALKMVLNF